jgi:hypothetical protein
MNNAQEKPDGGPSQVDVELLVAPTVRTLVDLSKEAQMVVVVLPWLLARAVGAEPREQREATPLINTATSLLIAAALTVAAFAVSQPMANLEPSATTNAVPTAFGVILIALFVMTTRRHAVSQAAGFLMLDNGIAATAFLLTAGVPLIVETRGLAGRAVRGDRDRGAHRPAAAHLRRRRPGPTTGAARLMAGFASCCGPLSCSHHRGF